MKDFLLFIKKIKDQAKKNQEIIFQFFPVFFLVLVLLGIFLFNTHTKDQILKGKIIPFENSIQGVAPYPILNSVLGIKTFNDTRFLSSPEISAQAAIVLDDDSKVTLFSKNSNLRFSMASTTKIMTAITALGYYKMNDVLIIKSDNTEGAVIGFKKGERVSFENLLYAMLLPSGNDAAYALAQNYPLGEEGFIKKMNEKAKEFNLYNTHYQDPAGLLDNQDYTTVTDLARLASMAVKNKEFAKIVATEYKQISNIEKTKKYDLFNLNKLLGVDGIDGIKTGFTEEAEGVLVTSRVKNGHKLIIVVMKSKDRFLDTQKLLNYVSDINYIKIKNN